MGRRIIPWAVVLCVILTTREVEARPRVRGMMPASKTISLNVFRADIHNVIRLFSEVSGANFVLDDDVKGKVTVRLRRVGWLRALKVILRSRGLEAQFDGNIIRVARQQTLAAERQAVLTTRQRCLQNAPLRTRLFRPSYASAARLAPLIRGSLTARGKVQVDERTNTLIVRDVECPR